MTEDEHRATLAQLQATLEEEEAKGIRLEFVLRRYLRQHRLRAGVVRFPDDTVRLVWQDPAPEPA